MQYLLVPCMGHGYSLFFLVSSPLEVAIIPTGSGHVQERPIASSPLLRTVWKMRRRRDGVVISPLLLSDVRHGLLHEHDHVNKQTPSTRRQNKKKHQVPHAPTHLLLKQSRLAMQFRLWTGWHPLPPSSCPPSPDRHYSQAYPNTPPYPLKRKQPRRQRQGFGQQQWPQ